jgi:hypothetical protein
MNSSVSLISPLVCLLLAPPWFDIPVGGEQVFEYEMVDIDGHREVRVSTDRSGQYPAEQWARDHAALGHRVRWRRIVVVDDWADLPLHRAVTDCRSQPPDGGPVA